MSNKYESVLFICPKVNVYMVPPPTGRGFKTDSWGPLAQPIFTGRLRVIQTFGDDKSPSTCDIRIEDASSGDLFASAPYIGEHAVERAQDSSRYYQLRVVQDKRVAYLGIGFEEREASFDFQVALEDFNKHLKVEKGESKQQSNAKVVHDYSLKQGQSITVNLGGKPKLGIDVPARTDSPATIPFLAPPPSAAEIRSSMSTSDMLDDDFGDFH